MSQKDSPNRRSTALLLAIAYSVIGFVFGYAVFLITDMVVYRVTAVFLIIIFLSNAYARLFVRAL